jgi:Tfp pilus assembly protein PilF
MQRLSLSVLVAVFMLVVMLLPAGQQGTVRAESAQSHFDRARAYIINRQPEQAMSELNDAIALNPKYAEAYELRAILYYHKPDYDKAWSDVHTTQRLGKKVDIRFLQKLRKVSGRKR